MVSMGGVYTESIPWSLRGFDRRYAVRPLCVGKAHLKRSADLDLEYSTCGYNVHSHYAIRRNGTNRGFIIDSFAERRFTEIGRSKNQD